MPEALTRLPVYRGINIFRILAFAGIIGPMVLIVGDLSAALSNPRYSLVHDTISSLALTQIGWAQTIGFLAMGLLVEIFVAGLLFSIKGVRWFGISIGALVFFGFGLLMIGAFHTDPVGGPKAIEGTIHGIASLFAFWLFPIAVLALAPSIRSDANWNMLFKYDRMTGILGLIFVVGLLLIKSHISWFGLYERLLVANMIVWVEVMAFQLLRLSSVKSETSTP
jgi:hypothetical protein